MIQIDEPRKSPAFALFNLGFRPFFLLGAITAALLMGLWLIIYSGGIAVNYYTSAVYWHGHEMLFGFTLAIIGGFLLTAVRNWTSVQTIYGKPLALLALIWLTARILPLVGGIPGEIIAAVDLAFAPLLTLAIAYPVIRSRNYKNLLFVPILSLFFVANLLVHLEVLGMTENTAFTGLHMALYLAIMIITVIGGRVIPFFTERGVQGASCHRYAWVEKAVIPTTLLWLIAMLSGIPELILALSLCTFALSLIRLYGWFNLPLLRVPLVWVLHLGYFFITLGFLLTALSIQQLISSSVAIHSFAAGGIGLMTLGMMARISLGHTGRPLTMGPMMISAFVLMTLSAIIRVSITSLPIPYLAGLHFSGTLWILAWILFLIRYLPILSKPRADGLFG
ncbi:MAG: NnrS family protein [Pontibacterium sp.]